MTSKSKDIHIKYQFKTITKIEVVIDYKIIREIERKIYANASTIWSKLGGRQHGILGLEMQQYMHHTVKDHDSIQPACTPQVDLVPPNTYTAKVPRWIQHHAAKVNQWRQKVNDKYILKQQLIDSLGKIIQASMSSLH